MAVYTFKELKREAVRWFPPGHEKHKPIVDVGPGQKGGFFLHRGAYSGMCFALKLGDWIVTGCAGEKYVYSNEAFLATFRELTL